MKQYRYLDEGLGDIAVIRTTFETVSLFPQNDPICAELETIVFAARANMVRRLQELCHLMRTDPTALALNYRKLRVYALDMMTRGHLCRDLNRRMKVNVYAGSEGALYYFEAPGLPDPDVALQMPASEFAVMLYAEVLRVAQVQDHYIDLPTFDRQVFQKYIALTFLHHCALDPIDKAAP